MDSPINETLNNINHPPHHPPLPTQNNNNINSDANTNIHKYQIELKLRLLNEINEAAHKLSGVTANANLICDKRPLHYPNLEAVKIQTTGALKILDKALSNPHMISAAYSPMPRSELISSDFASLKLTVPNGGKSDSNKPIQDSNEPNCRLPITGLDRSEITRLHKNPHLPLSAVSSQATAAAQSPPRSTASPARDKHMYLREFPESLMLGEVELMQIADEHPQSQFKKSFWSIGNFVGRSRSKSTEGLHDLMSLYEHRIRHSREDYGRRKSFSSETWSHRRRPEWLTDLLEDGHILTDSSGSSSSRGLFASSSAAFGGNISPTSNSSLSILGEERWPERICSHLTNGQRIKSRLKMFRHFSGLTKSIEEERLLLTAEDDDDGEINALPPAKTKNLRLVSGAWTIAKSGKPNGGEDAYFHNADTREFSFAGVADGVGEWGEYDCCPKQFATELMDGSKGKACELPFHTKAGRNSSSSEDQNTVEEKASQRALKVLRAGFEKALNASNCFGSSTTLVAGLDEKGETLGVASLGDSTCIVLRRSQPRFKNMTIAKRTKEQQHFFNCPYQLSRLPMMSDLPHLEQRGMYKLVRVMNNIKPGMCSDSPDQADLTDLRVREGDLIILGTDGLFDNLFDQEIISLASLSLSPYESKLFLRGQLQQQWDVSKDGITYSDNSSSERTISNISSPERKISSPALTTSALADHRTALDSARKITEAWVTGAMPHPMAVEPPECTRQFGIATAPQDVARGIAEAAYYRSIDGRARTPFAKAARAAGASATGGKQDDITVVACWVVSAEDQDENLGHSVGNYF